VPERVEGTDSREDTTKAKDRKYLELNVERCFRIFKFLENLQLFQSQFKPAGYGLLASCFSCRTVPDVECDRYGLPG
jgi:hypothetical protein